MYSSFNATSGCISPSNSKSTFLSLRISTAFLICLVLLVRCCPNVEWDTKATFGSIPKRRTTLAAEIAISDISSDDGYSCTLVSATKIVLPLNTIIFNPNIISLFLAPTTCVIFSNEAPNLLVFPVTAPSASPQATMLAAQTTRSFLTNLSQSLSNSPFSLWSFWNKYWTYFFLFSVSLEFTISISKFSL